MSDEEEDDLGIKPGTVIDSSKANYVVIKLLGEGGFGAVFKFTEDDDRLVYQGFQIAILKLVSQERTHSHFTSIVDRGKKETYFFLVMELVGKSLADLKHHRPGRVFSMSTGLGASIQCLEACEDLHKHGFIHRDLKPANYACGLGDKKRIIYILDFGIARKILNEKGELKTPRMTVKFKGTIPFASISCHRNTEMGPKDDCESWFYLLIDITFPQGLLWKALSEKNEVLHMKEEIRKEKRDAQFLNIKCKEELQRVMDYIDSLHYHDHVDYSFIYKLLEEVGKQRILTSRIRRIARSTVGGNWCRSGSIGWGRLDWGLSQQVAACMILMIGKWRRQESGEVDTI
ncbi:unnamed protein product [Haemonchus placei]|uniref:Protein kinase domain-containing protein n=1 Tax=Haemonchus placei TaxID=6290 RepID=A0A158QPW8_HAEPC|nr:unnamed protein product [Haemonchus placei]